MRRSGITTSNAAGPSILIRRLDLPLQARVRRKLLDQIERFPPTIHDIA